MTADPALTAAPTVGAWEALLGVALVGTARRRPPLGFGAEIGLAPADGTDPAALLLAEAAAQSAYRRAGWQPAEAPRSLPEPAEPDGRPACSPAAVEVLELVLSGQVPIPGGVALLAGQWVDGAARVGCRVPARLLPQLLELGSLNASLQPAVRTVVGPRGRWLTHYHDRWSWAAGEPVDDLNAVAARFATAAKAERPALLEALRVTDPVRGRELLAATWKTEPAAERAALLAVLAAGLSDDDEPFLEAALHDRSAAVRQVAVDLLGRLPASRRAARMAERLRALIVTNSAGLSFGPPGEPDAAARRDGINDAAPAGMGISAWRLLQMIAGTPLSFWAEAVGLGPEEMVALAAAADGPLRGKGSRPSAPGGHGPPAGPVLLGFEAAVVAQAGRAPSGWAAALFRHRPSAATLAVLPPGDAATQLTELLAGGVGPGPPVAQLLAACPGPWPEALGRAVLDRYRQLGGRAVLELQGALPVLAARLDPAALPLVEAWAAALAEDQGLRRRVQTLGHALSLRAVIHRELVS